DPRVPLGKDKNGRPFFAARGTRTTYRIPDLKGGSTPAAIKPAKAATRLAAFLAERQQDAERLSKQKGNRRPNRKATGVQTERRQDACCPSLNEPSKNPHTYTAPSDRDGWMPEATRVILKALRVDHPEATRDDAKAVHRAVIAK